MSKSEIIEFLKNNLSLHITQECGFYRQEGGLHTLKLKLCDETISETYLEIPVVGNNG